MKLGKTNRPVEAVTFDVGGTLIEAFPSVGAVYAEVARERGLGPFAPEVLTQGFILAWKKRGAFQYTRAGWKELVCQTFAGHCQVDDQLFTAIYDRFLEAESWRVFSDVLPALARLKGAGVKLGVVSNWDDRLPPLLKNLELWEYFDEVIVSVEVGAHKPDARIFQEAARRLRTAPEAILHVGDSTQEDCHGALAAGFQAVVIERPENSLMGIVEVVLRG